MKRFNAFCEPSGIGNCNAHASIFIEERLEQQPCGAKNPKMFQHTGPQDDIENRRP
jgi:hypothetical protein